MNRIKIGDQVVVVTGKDKGRTGNIVQILDEQDRVIVENVNMAKRHTKANPGKNEAGGIVEKAMPIHVSNIMPYNPVTKKGDRVGIKTLEDGKRVRCYKSNGEVIDV